VSRQRDSAGGSCALGAEATAPVGVATAAGDAFLAASPPSVGAVRRRPASASDDDDEEEEDDDDDEEEDNDDAVLICRPERRYWRSLSVSRANQN